MAQAKTQPDLVMTMAASALPFATAVIISSPAERAAKNAPTKESPAPFVSTMVLWSTAGTGMY